jgi:hypothetical protein
MRLLSYISNLAKVKSTNTFSNIFLYLYVSRKLIDFHVFYIFFLTDFGCMYILIIVWKCHPNWFLWQLFINIFFIPIRGQNRSFLMFEMRMQTLLDILPSLILRMILFRKVRTLVWHGKNLWVMSFVK